MKEQEKAISMLKSLKLHGVSYKEFASETGVKIDVLYTYTSNANKMPLEMAKFIIYSIQKHYPMQYELYKEMEEFCK